jgi:mRNA interferase RelE/StbE
MKTGMTISWSARALKDMRPLSPNHRDRVIAKVEQYAADPASLANQVRALTGSALLRLRVGDHRVIFRIEGGEVTVMLVLRVRHRREAYD